MRYVALIAAAFLLSGVALAQHKHGIMKGPNGGPMQDVADVHAELITTGNTVTINVFDEANKPVSAAGFTGSVLIVAGAERETIALAPSGTSALKGDAKRTIAAGAAFTVVLKNAAGKSGQVKY